MNAHVVKFSLQTKSFVKRILGYRGWNSDVDQLALIKDPHVIFDIGANVGQTAMRYRVIFPDARIFSFEPVLETYTKLQKLFAGDKQVETVQTAISDECSTMPMYIQNDSLLNSMLKPSGDWTDTKETIRVPATTIDTFCEERRIDQVDILKVDVEGSELAVFRGAEEMFRRRAIRNVFTEVYFSPAYSGMPLFSDLDKALKDKGFILYGLYSLTPACEGYLLNGNALYRLTS
jgi:FkbM family methyltransferase